MVNLCSNESDEADDPNGVIARNNGWPFPSYRCQHNGNSLLYSTAICSLKLLARTEAKIFDCQRLFVCSNASVSSSAYSDDSEIQILESAGLCEIMFGHSYSLALSCTVQ